MFSNVSVLVWGFNHEASNLGVFFGGVANDNCCAASATDDDGA